MINVGIYCPEWLVARHNTDHRIAKMFGQLGDFSEVKTEFVASETYTKTFNFNRLLSRLLPGIPPLVDYGMRKTEEIVDLIYHYGSPIDPAAFFKTIKGIPAFITTGFMTDEFVTNLRGKLPNRQKEADELAQSLEKAAVVHFHTQSGMERFLSYRPDFKERAVAIPFFLPNLTADDYVRPDRKHVKILFVGVDGKRKGLFNLLDALDLLGHDYMERFHVEVIIVSKDKPKPKTNYKLSWYPQLPHQEVKKLMKEAAIFVLVPKNESYGLVLVEAMLAGCTIVTDDDETRQEIIGNTGIMLDNKCAANIARTLRVLIEDTYWREVLGKNASVRAKQLFLPQNVAKQYKESFQSVLVKTPIIK